MILIILMMMKMIIQMKTIQTLIDLDPEEEVMIVRMMIVVRVEIIRAGKLNLKRKKKNKRMKKMKKMKISRDRG